MKIPISVCCLLVLTVLVETLAQERASPCEQKEQKFAAVVVGQVVGTCQVRDDENAKPSSIKSGTAVRAGQSLQCVSGAQLKIQFCNSRAEKEVKQNAPRWYVVPNVPAIHEPSGVVAALRRNSWYCPPPNVCPAYSRYTYTDSVALKEIELWKLYQKKEARALGESMSDDFYAIYPDGQRVSKQRFLQDMVKIDLQEFLWSDVAAEIDTATGNEKLSYVVFAHLSSNGRKSSILFEVTSKWVERGGRWYITSHRQKNILDSEG
jgi:hypothetical protein